MNQQATEPVWYRQFWPWFLIALPGSVVIAGFITLYIAIVNAPSMVSDNYYKDGLAINRSLLEDELARKNLISAKLQIDNDNKEILLTLNGQQVEDNGVLILYFIHPVDSKSDFEVPLQKNTDGSYRQSILTLDKTRWYLQLSPVVASPEQRWRIRGEIDLSHTAYTILSSS